MAAFRAPAGLVHGVEAVRLVAAGLARPLAPGLAYMAVEESSRAGEGVERRLLGLDAAPAFGTGADPFAALDLPADRPLIMGIINATPDSFSDGGRHLGAGGFTAIARMVADGADLIDIGGESTRPGAEEVSPGEEIDRVCPLIEAAAGLGVPVSVDTRKAAVMAAALAAGAALVNDVSAGRFDRDTLPLLAGARCPLVLMHARGTPATMQADPQYHDVVFEVTAELAERIAACVAGGIAVERLVVDPGIGFAKTAAHNVTLLDGLAGLHALGRPLLLGVSRKSFIGRLSDNAPVDRRLPGSLAAALAGLDRGVRVLRVHDVPETVQALRLWQAMRCSCEAGL